MLLVAWLAVATLAYSGADERCLLAGGGSTERFLVPEDLAVGKEVGALSIQVNLAFASGLVIQNLNQGEVGVDIAVRLDDPTVPLVVESRNGSAVLVLTGQLDREGEAGPAALATSLTCDRLGEAGGDPGWDIPVNIRSVKTIV